MRVLVLCNAYPTGEDPSWGTYVHDQVSALRARGVQVDVLFINGRASRRNYVAGPWRLWRQIAHVRYDLVHAHYVFAGWIARTQCLLPIIQSFHGGGEMLGYQGTLCRWLAPLVDAVTVTSADHRQRLRFADARIIPCGVDLGLFAPQARDEARAKLGWPLDRQVILWVGEARPEKRLDLLRAAHALLAERGLDADLRLISGVPHDSVPTYMNASDVFALASMAEGSPVVVKEAMACNLPVVSTDVGDVADVIAGVEGCYLADANAEDLAGKLEKALRIGGRTRGREAVAHLQQEGEAQAIISLYGEVLSSRRGHRARRRG